VSDSEVLQLAADRLLLPSEKFSPIVKEIAKSYGFAARWHDGEMYGGVDLPLEWHFLTAALSALESGHGLYAIQGCLGHDLLESKNGKPSLEDLKSYFGQPAIDAIKLMENGTAQNKTSLWKDGILPFGNTRPAEREQKRAKGIEKVQGNPIACVLRDLDAASN